MGFQPMRSDRRSWVALQLSDANPSAAFFALRIVLKIPGFLAPRAASLSR